MKMLILLRGAVSYPSKLELKCEKLNSSAGILNQILKKLYLESMKSFYGFASKQHGDLYCAKVVIRENITVLLVILNMNSLGWKKRLE